MGPDDARAAYEALASRLPPRISARQPYDLA
jgi:hypothetical protein